MYEDWFLDDDFHVETNRELIEEEGADEVFRFLSPCRNCGELVSKGNLHDGICNLCSCSETHARIRGGSSEASSNYHTLEDVCKKIEDHFDH